VWYRFIYAETFAPKSELVLWREADNALYVLFIDKNDHQQKIPYDIAMKSNLKPDLPAFTKFYKLPSEIKEKIPNWDFDKQPKLKTEKSLFSDEGYQIDHNTGIISEPMITQRIRANQYDQNDADDFLLRTQRWVGHTLRELYDDALKYRGEHYANNLVAWYRSFHPEAEADFIVDDSNLRGNNFVTGV